MWLFISKSVTIKEKRRELQFAAVGNMMPKEPAMLLSFVNLKLRDYYDSLDTLCGDLQADPGEITQTLAAIGYHYDADRNQFV